jgi:hypothetical protein
MSEDKTAYEGIPARVQSHMQIFGAVYRHAQAIVDMTSAVPAECNPGELDTHSLRKFYIAVAYRWGFTNEHWYFVYVGLDAVKAVTLAEHEAQDRGGKYGCVVYEFDEGGTDYQQIFYSPSMTEEPSTKGPQHNHRVDYFIALGLFFDSACEGAVYLPNQANESKLHKEVVTVPDVLKAERDRQRERMLAVMAASANLAANKETKDNG